MIRRVAHNVLPHLAAVHDVEKLRTSTDTHHEHAPIETLIEHFLVDHVSHGVAAGQWVPVLGVHLRTHVGATCEAHNLRIVDVLGPTKVARLRKHQAVVKLAWAVDENPNLLIAFQVGYC